jgi:chemotaxis protein CheC
LTGLLDAAPEAVYAYESMQTAKLTTQQLEDFLEIGNIGAGNAASRLSDLIGRRCFISLPKAVYSDVKNLKDNLGLDNTFAVAIHLEAVGDIRCRFLLFMKWLYAPIIVHYMKKAASSAAGEEVDMAAEFALKRLAEMMAKTFTESINRFLMLSGRLTVPEMTIDSGSTALNHILNGKEDVDTEQLVVHVDFNDYEKTFDGKLVYMINPGSQLILLNQLASVTAAKV